MVEDKNIEKNPEAAIVELSEQENVRIPLRLQIPGGMPSRYAHHLIVQPTDHEVVLSFFEVQPPLLMGNIEEQKEQLKNGIRADCVARVTIAKARYPEFVAAMQSVLDVPEEKKEKP